MNGSVVCSNEFILTVLKHLFILWHERGTLATQVGMRHSHDYVIKESLVSRPHCSFIISFLFLSTKIPTWEFNFTYKIQILFHLGINCVSHKRLQNKLASLRAKKEHKVNFLSNKPRSQARILIYQ